MQAQAAEETNFTWPFVNRSTFRNMDDVSNNILNFQSLLPVIPVPSYPGIVYSNYLLEYRLEHNMYLQWFSARDIWIQLHFECHVTSNFTL